MELLASKIDLARYFTLMMKIMIPMKLWRVSLGIATDLRSFMISSKLVIVIADLAKTPKTPS